MLMEETMVNHQKDFELEVFYKGDYYPVDANVYSEGTYSIVQDDQGYEYLDIETDPCFMDVVIYDPEEGNPMKTYDLFSDREAKEDEMNELALYVLRELYWDRLSA